MVLLADSLVVVDSVHEKDVVNEDFSILLFEVFWTFSAVGDTERRDYAFDLLRFRGHSELVEKVAYIDVNSLPTKIKLIDVRLYYFRVGVLVAQKLTYRELWQPWGLQELGDVDWGVAFYDAVFDAEIDPFFGFFVEQHGAYFFGVLSGIVITVFD